MATRTKTQSRNRSRNRKTKRRTKPNPTRLNTIAGARDYFRDLKKLTDLIRTLTRHHVIDELNDVGEIEPLKTDALKQPKKLSTKQRRIQAAVDKAQRAFESAMDTDEMRRIARRNATRTDRGNKGAVEKQLRLSAGAIGVRRLEDIDSSRIRATFVRRNVDLIKTIGPQHFDKLRSTIDDAFAKGRSSRALRADIQAIGGVTQRRAALIARDQIGSLNSQLTKERQKANGVSQFIWRTVGDERVREEHDALNEQTFDIDKGAPGEGFPGEPINCRCYSEPVF